MRKYEFRLEKIVSPLMEESYYEVLSKPVGFSSMPISLDEFYLNLSYKDCLVLIKETFKFLKGQSCIRVSINVNHKMINNSVLVEFICREVERLKVNDVFISLELNENCIALINIDTFNNAIKKFLSIDVEFWLDDFGCGSANLSSVIDYKFKFIKIDKKIFWSLYLKYKYLLVELISFIKDMGCSVVIEGIENKQQLEFSLENGCYSQGYFFNDEI